MSLGQRAGKASTIVRVGVPHIAREAVGVVEFIKQLLAHLPNKTRLIIRADSGYFVGALLDLLDAHKHDYLIKVKLKNLVLLLTGGSWFRIVIL